MFNISQVGHYLLSKYCVCRYFTRNNCTNSTNRFDTSMQGCFPKASLANYSCKFHLTLLVTTLLATKVAFWKHTPEQSVFIGASFKHVFLVRAAQSSAAHLQ